jgi:hypothetical protein
MVDETPDNAPPDPKRRMLDLIGSLNAEQLATVNHALVDALVSSARGEPSSYPINETVHISQEEARRICKKIGLDWDSGKMQSE